MTTIAWDGKTLAVDSKETANGTIISTSRKKLYLDQGQYKAVAISGDLVDCLNIIDWIASGGLGDKPAIPEGSSIIAIDECGRAYRYISPCLIRLEIKAPYGDGSGYELVLGAMDAGATAVEAVKIACKRDVYTGGRVRSYTHSDERKVLRPAKVGSVTGAQARAAVAKVNKL